MWLISPNFLLNVDSKILAKMLALRLERVLPSLISEDQTGLIKNRQLSSNIRRLLNVLYDPTPSKGTEVLISLDAEKAFDRVEWDYLLYILKCFGFGEKCIHWIKMLYSHLFSICNVALDRVVPCHLFSSP